MKGVELTRLLVRNKRKTFGKRETPRDDRGVSILFLVICAFFLLVMALFYKDYGVSWDESFYLKSGKAVAENFFNVKRIIELVPLYHLLTHGSLFDSFIFALVRLVGGEGSFEKLHLVKAVFNSSALVFVFLTLRRLGVGKLSSLVGVLLLIFTPRWFGDVFDNQMDTVSVVVYALMMLMGVAVIEGKNDKGLLTKIFLLSPLSAIAFSHRVVLFFLPILIWVFLVAKAGLVRCRKLLGLLVIFTVLFGMTLFVIDPYIRYFGLWGIWGKITLPEEFSGLYVPTTLFDGLIYLTSTLPWYYLPKWILISTPLVLLAFFFVGIWRACFERKQVLIFLLLSFFGPVAAVILGHLPLYDAWRHFLFLVIPLALLASLGFEFIWNSQRKTIKFLAIVLLLLNIFLAGSEMVRLHPYEYTYFNEVVGNLAGANGKYETDYWGKSFKEAILWLRNYKEVRQGGGTKVATCGDQTQSTYFFSSKMEWTGSLSTADFFVCYTRFNQHLLVDQSKTIYIVGREGVPLGYVKKLR